MGFSSPQGNFFFVRTWEPEVLLLQNIALPLGAGVTVIKPNGTQFKVFSRETEVYKNTVFLELYSHGINTCGKSNF